MKGKLVRWNAERGFGFIRSEQESSDIFIHISELRQMSRPPVQGDDIEFNLAPGKDGRLCAVNARIEGVFSIDARPDVPIRVAKPKHGQRVQRSELRTVRSRARVRSDRLSRKVTYIILLGAFAGAVYWKFGTEIRKVSGVVESGSVVEVPVNEASKPAYQCEGKTHCSEMTSCEEARFYLRNCPGTQMDGDGDGVPCESQWCN